ncbi:tetratricopeptide repeat protein [Spongiactinospora sp. TRM90649]|uniref:tetratricopeptide repeat protein n=1 Tax=Spongiactinospora sp. TRM90649 TaxID=3031114 RepID=UPI0023F65299|nr:tetratricopeptide repeat protein [Spongiactinospora sp. TRM90649]MDF5758272.1 tetratricopeptide repeat protein [Spongiactinospora sp. TRM90649]
MAVEDSEVLALIKRATDMPYGQAKTVLLERALALAEGARARDVVFQVRLSLTEAYQYGAEPAKSFTTFSRCLAEYDAEPGRFGEWETYNLLWQFKWIISDMTRFPEIPLRRAQDALAEMERRYQESGFGLHAVYAQRCYLAQHIGDQAAADEWFHRWVTTPRDALSDCEGCDPSGKVWHLAWMGRDEEAVELAAPVVAGDLTCHVQPQGILTRLLLPYLRTERFAEAVGAHRRAYRIVTGDANYVDDFGDHIEFCALTGNEARGLEILQRESPLLDRAASPRAAMRFASAAGLLMRRLEEIGHGDAVVRRPDGDLTVHELRPRMEATARDLAARFDARNGTAEQSRRVEETLTAAPMIDHLPLTPHARRVTVPPPAPPAVAVPERATPGELLDLAERAWDEADFGAALAAWGRFDELYEQAGPEGVTEVERARRADGRGLAMVHDDPAGAAAEWERAALAYEAAGDEVRRQVALGRLALLRLTQDEDGHWIAVAEASAAHLSGHGTPAQATAAAGRLAQAYRQAGRVDDAISLLERHTETAPDPGWPLLRLAEILAEDPAKWTIATATAARAREALRPSGGIRLATACLLHARLLREGAYHPTDPPNEEPTPTIDPRPFGAPGVLGDSGDSHSPGEVAGEADGEGGAFARSVFGERLASAVSAYGEALATAPRADVALRAFAHAGRGEALLGVDRSVEAADDLIEAVAALTSIGATEQAAAVRVDLCRAYLAIGRPLDAAEAAEEALAMLPEGQTDERLTARWVRADAQRDLADAGEMGDREAALADYAAVEAELLARGRRIEAAGVTEAIGHVLMGLNRHEEAAEAYAKAAAAHEDDPLNAARLLRRKGMAVYQIDGAEERALEIFATARAALAGLPTAYPAVVWETCRIGFEEARALDWLGRWESALRRCAEIAEGFTAIGAEDAAREAGELADHIRLRMAEEQEDDGEFDEFDQPDTEDSGDSGGTNRTFA